MSLEDFDADKGIQTDAEQPTTNPFQTGDPVMDATQGRPMVVLAARDETVAEWSEANGYDLMDNYGNKKFDPTPDEFVVECVYVSDLRSEPSKSYTFPTSRVRLIDAHHADDGRRIGDRVVVELLESLFGAALDLDHTPDVDAVSTLVAEAGVGDELQEVASELAEAARIESMGTDE